MAILATLAGCGSSGADGDPSVSAVPTSAALTIPNGVVATGEFTSLDAVTVGRVEGTYDGEALNFTFPGFATGTYPQLLLAFADDELGADDCFYDRYQVAFAYAPGQEDIYASFANDQYSGDPSFFSTLAVLEYPTGPAAAGECGFRTLAVSPLTWSIPDLHPDLVVEDAGETTGASGEIATDDLGAPLTYLTRAGDTWSQIAERFGVTPQELLYLNPCRPIAYEPDLAYADELLNLSKQLRGERL